MYVVLNGKESSTTDVVSGVPQGSVRTGTTVVSFVHKRLSARTSVRWYSNISYADDILMYRIINCIQDHEMLQNDTNTVSIIIMG